MCIFYCGSCSSNDANFLLLICDLCIFCFLCAPRMKNRNLCSKILIDFCSLHSCILCPLFAICLFLLVCRLNFLMLFSVFRLFCIGILCHLSLVLIWGFHSLAFPIGIIQNCYYRYLSFFFIIYWLFYRFFIIHFSRIL